MLHIPHSRNSVEFLFGTRFTYETHTSKVTITTMALDDLQILIDVVDSFSEEIDELIADLEAANIAAEDVDNIVIDVDVHGNLQIEALRAQISALNDKEIDIDTDVDQLDQIQALQAGLLGGLLSGAGGGDFDGGALNAMMGGARGDEADSFELANLRMSDLHNALAKLVPLILVYIGALGPVIGAVGALGAAALGAAAALGSIAGLGLLGMTMGMEGDMMQNMSDILETIQEDFMDAFGPLAEQLAPMFQRMLSGLERFFDELAARGQVLLDFRDDARAFGNFIIETIPNVLASLIRFADAMGPVFARIGQTIQDLDVLETLASFFAESLPALIMLGSELLELISLLGPLTIGFARVAAVATKVINTFINVITLGGRLNDALGTSIAMTLALATAVSILGSSLLKKAVMGVGSAVVSLWNYIGTMGVATSASEAMIIANEILAGSFATLKVAIIGVLTTLSVLGVALVALGGIVNTVFGAATSEIDKATKSLKEFKDVEDSIGSGIGGGPRSNIFEFTPTGKNPTVINADNVPDAKRLNSYESFRRRESTNANVSK